MVEFIFGISGFLLVVVGLFFAARSVVDTMYNADGSLKQIEEDKEVGAKVYRKLGRVKHFHFLIALGAGCLLVALGIQANQLFGATQGGVKSLVDITIWQQFAVKFAWAGNCLGLIFILLTRVCSNYKGTWGGTGCLLIIIAIGNAAILVGVQLNPGQQLASIIGLGVLGALGTRFLGNWLTDKAR